MYNNLSITYYLFNLNNLLEFKIDLEFCVIGNWIFAVKFTDSFFKRIAFKLSICCFKHSSTEPMFKLKVILYK